MKYQINYKHVSSIKSTVTYINSEMSNIIWEVSNLELSRNITDEHIVRRFDKRPPTGHMSQIHLSSQTDPIVWANTSG